MRLIHLMEYVIFIVLFSLFGASFMKHLLGVFLDDNPVAETFWRYWYSTFTFPLHFIAGFSTIMVRKKIVILTIHSHLCWITSISIRLINLTVFHSSRHSILIKFCKPNRKTPHPTGTPQDPMVILIGCTMRCFSTILNAAVLRISILVVTDLWIAFSMSTMIHSTIWINVQNSLSSTALFLTAGSFSKFFNGNKYSYKYASLDSMVFRLSSSKKTHDFLDRLTPRWTACSNVRVRMALFLRHITTQASQPQNLALERLVFCPVSTSYGW